MTIRLCDDRGPHGFSWIVDEPATRTSHALASDGRVWLVDPVQHEPALERVRGLGEPVAVVQLLDRHNRDCAAVAEELRVPHVVVPDAVPDSPFEAVPVKRTKRWRETALWWPAERTLLVAEAIGTNQFFAPPGHHAGVHLLLRLSPPRGARSAHSSRSTFSSVTVRGCTATRRRRASTMRSTTRAEDSPGLRRAYPRSPWMRLAAVAAMRTSNGEPLR